MMTHHHWATGSWSRLMECVLCGHSGIISHVQHEPGEVSDESDGLHDGWVQRGEPDEGDGGKRCLLLAWGEEIKRGMLDTLCTQCSQIFLMLKLILTSAEPTLRQLGKKQAKHFLLPHNNFLMACSTSTTHIFIIWSNCDQSLCAIVLTFKFFQYIWPIDMV